MEICPRTDVSDIQSDSTSGKQESGRQLLARAAQLAVWHGCPQIVAGRDIYECCCKYTDCIQPIFCSILLFFKSLRVQGLLMAPFCCMHITNVIIVGPIDWKDVLRVTRIFSYH